MIIAQSQVLLSHLRGIKMEKTFQEAGTSVCSTVGIIASKYEAYIKLKIKHKTYMFCREIIKKTSEIVFEL